MIVQVHVRKIEVIMETEVWGLALTMRLPVSRINSYTLALPALSRNNCPPAETCNIYPFSYNS